MSTSESFSQIQPAKGCSASQLALAWVLALRQDVVPIPGSKRRSYLAENIAAVGVVLTDRDLREIAEAAPAGPAAGLRYPEAAMASVRR